MNTRLAKVYYRVDSAQSIRTLIFCVHQVGVSSLERNREKIYMHKDRRMDEMVFAHTSSMPILRSFGPGRSIVVHPALEE